MRTISTMCRLVKSTACYHEEHSSRRGNGGGSIDFLRMLLVCVVKLLFTPPKFKEVVRSNLKLALEN
jgi:hypothetical protein